VTKYDPHTRVDGLFADYINTFLKLKAEFSGYPGWVRNPKDEERYFETFNASKVVLTDMDAKRLIASKEGLAKLCLNLLWGKLTERQNKPRPS
jgi:hypothetical protein